MARKLHYFSTLVCITTVLAKSPVPDLPPCPTNFQFLPQNLPMHCKMMNSPPLAPPFPPIFPGPKPIDQNPPAPGANKPAAPAVPQPPIGMPMGMGPAMPMGMPAMPMGMPGMPMPMPMVGPPQTKLPVIVMPFYSPDSSYKDSKPNDAHPKPKPHKRKIKILKKSHRHSDTETDTDSSSDTDTDSSSSDSDRGWWKNRRAMRRRKKIRHTSKKEDYLTPILQYVSNDGYVIFEKEISREEAKDWLADKDRKQKENGQKEESLSKKPITEDQKVVINNKIHSKKKITRRVKPNLLMPQAVTNQQQHEE